MKRGRIDGHVGRAGLEHAQDGAHDVDRVLHVERDELIRANAVGVEVRRNLVRAVVELAIRQRSIREADGVLVRRARHLSFKELDDRLVGRVGRGGVVEFAV